MDIESVKFGYSLAQRDMLALELAQAKHDKKKMSEKAELYKKHYGEHFSLNYHLSKQ